MKFTLNHALYAAALLASAEAPAAAADISVFSSGAPSAVLKVLAVAFARQTGNPLLEHITAEKEFIFLMQRK